MNPQEPASSSGGVLKARPLLARAHGRDPDTAAASAICKVTPTGCQARTRLYRDGRLEIEGFPVSEISDHLVDEAVTIWLDLRDPDHDDLSVLSEEFGLHPLAVEDAVGERQRPKLDRYATHDFLSAYAVWLDVGTGELHSKEIAVFITNPALITVRKDDEFDIDAVVARWDDTPDLAGFGVGACCTGCSTMSSTATSRRCRAWTTPSRRWRTSSSPMFRRTCRSSGAASSCARAWSCSAGS